MAKVTEYPRITKMKDNDILLVDGPDGTRTILQTDASKQMGGEVIMVNESAGDSTKVVINTTDEDIELATMEDLEPVEEDVSELKTQLNDLFHKYICDIIIQTVDSGAADADSEWENGAINSDGDDASGQNQRRTGIIPLIAGTVFKTKSTNGSVTLYLYEYASNGAYLGRHSSNTDTLSPQETGCSYVRLMTYSTAVSQADQDSYIIAQYTNDISSQISELEDRADAADARITAEAGRVDELVNERTELLQTGETTILTPWEKGQIGNDGMNAPGNNHMRTANYIDILDYDFEAVMTAPASGSLAMYLVEYGVNKTYLGKQSLYSAGSLSPIETGTRFVRVFTYSTTVTPDDQVSYITLKLQNDNNIDAAFGDFITESEYNADLHAFDLVGDDMTTYKVAEMKISATENNQGTTTYIYNNVIETETIGAVWAQVKEIINTAYSSVKIVCYIPGQSNISTTYTDADIKRGVTFIPPANTTKIVLQLYPSYTGGFTDTYAVYKGITMSVCKYPVNPHTYFQKYEDEVSYYYLQNDYLKDKIATIREKIVDAAGNYDAFVFCTDQHWSLNAKQSPALIKYLADRLNITRLFMGGDYGGGIELDAIRAYKNAFNGRIYNISGNHEYMDEFCVDGVRTHETITEGDVWLYLDGGMMDAVVGDAGRQYYYVDNPVQKMRYIILSVYKDNGGSAVLEFSADQKTWLQNTALNLPAGYTAFVFAHLIYNANSSTGEAEIVSNLTTDITNILDAYSGDGEIAGMISGHTHIDTMTITTGGIPAFVTTCDKCGAWISNGVDMEPWLTQNRHDGTITEQAFDVVVVDKNNKLVSLIRIGAPADNGNPMDTSDKLEIRQSYYGA